MWARESLSDFLGAQRTGRLRVSPAGQMRVEVSVRAPCSAGWNQAFLFSYYIIVDKVLDCNLVRDTIAVIIQYEGNELPSIEYGDV